MATKNKSISHLTVLALGALLVGLPATAALAAEPTNASDAQAMARHYRDQADQYRAMGGVGYKTGLVQRADADAAKYSALAEQLAVPAVATPARSPDAEHYAELAARYRAMGGAAYKTGLVQWAEAQQQKYEAPTVTAAPTTQPAYSTCAATKPAVRMLACNQ
jgi:hypothetical protein